MSARALAVIFASLWSVACASDGGSGDAGVVEDARILEDAGEPDSGRFGVGCGTSTCTEAQYCLVTPTSGCEASDGGACAPTEEVCQKDGVPGCAQPRQRRCVELPVACSATPSCACLIASNLCPEAIRTDCIKVERQGFTVECPYP